MSSTAANESCNKCGKPFAMGNRYYLKSVRIPICGDCAWPKTIDSDYVVCKRDLLERAADELEAYAEDGTDRGFACQESQDLAIRLRTVARAGKQS